MKPQLESMRQLELDFKATFSKQKQIIKSLETKDDTECGKDWKHGHSV